MIKELDFYRKEYERQKKLERIVNSRVLTRPNVKKWQVATCFAILPFLLFAFLFFTLITKFSTEAKILLIVLEVVFVVEVYLRVCFLLLVKYYQKTAKEETRRRCLCIPSCSEYALISLKRLFPLILALLKIRKRLYVTCDGKEFKIDFPTRKMGEKYEQSIK